MLKYFTFVTLCCLSTCALGFQCDFHPHADANSVLDIQFQPQDSRAAFTLSSMAMVPSPGASAIGALSAPSEPIKSLPGPQPTAMLPSMNGSTASLDVPSLPLARFIPDTGTYLHAELQQAELQIQTDRQAQKELAGRNSLSAIPGSSEAKIVPVARRRHHRDQRITSLTAFSQLVLLPTQKIVTPAMLTAMSDGQTFPGPMQTFPTEHPASGAASTAQVFADASDTHAPKAHFLQAVGTPGAGFTALSDALTRENQRPRTVVKPAELPTVIDTDQDGDED